MRTLWDKFLFIKKYKKTLYRSELEQENDRQEFLYKNWDSLAVHQNVLLSLSLATCPLTCPSCCRKINLKINLHYQVSNMILSHHIAYRNERKYESLTIMTCDGIYS